MCALSIPKLCSRSCQLVRRPRYLRYRNKTRGRSPAPDLNAGALIGIVGHQIKSSVIGIPTSRAAVTAWTTSNHFACFVGVEVSCDHSQRLPR
jgi:hypothetical protein